MRAATGSPSKEEQQENKKGTGRKIEWQRK